MRSIPGSGDRWAIVAARPPWDKIADFALNDGVKSYLSAAGDFAPFLELDHLAVMVAKPEYLLAMKCLAMRIGAEFHDEEDVRFLLRLLDIRSYERAVAIISRYYPIERFPRKALHALEELLAKGRGR